MQVPKDGLEESLKKKKKVDVNISKSSHFYIVECFSLQSRTTEFYTDEISMSKFWPGPCDEHMMETGNCNHSLRTKNSQGVPVIMYSATLDSFNKGLLAGFYDRIWVNEI